MKPSRPLSQIPDLTPDEALRQSDQRIRFLERDIADWKLLADAADDEAATVAMPKTGASD